MPSAAALPVQVKRSAVRSPILKSIITQRNEWIDYVNASNDNLRAIFADAASAIIDRIEAGTVDGKLDVAALPRLIETVSTQLAAARARIVQRITAMMAKSIDYGIKAGMAGAHAATGGHSKAGLGSAFVGKDGRVRKHDARQEVFSESKWAAIRARALNDLQRVLPQRKDVVEGRGSRDQGIPTRVAWRGVPASPRRCSCGGKVIHLHEATPSPGGQSLSERVWDLSNGAEKSIRQAVTSGVVQGTPAAAVAQSVRGYLNEPDRLYRRVRTASGALRLSPGARAYSPGAGVYRSAYKNAMRLSRTEMTRAFTEGTMRYGASKDWITGYIWRAGDAAPCPECEALEGKYFKKDEDIPLPLHPHCFCYLETVTDETEADAIAGSEQAQSEAATPEEANQDRLLPTFGGGKWDPLDPSMIPLPVDTPEDVRVEINAGLKLLEEHGARVDGIFVSDMTNAHSKYSILTNRIIFRKSFLADPRILMVEEQKAFLLKRTSDLAKQAIELRTAVGLERNMLIEKIAELNATKRFSVASTASNPISIASRHEGAHAVYVQRGLKDLWYNRIGTNGVRMVDRYQISDVAGKGEEQFFCETYTAYFGGYRSLIPDNVLKAFEETIANVK